jgi:ketosteroid isomerase-like protein
MHPNAELLSKLYTALDNKDHEAMAICYHPDATFQDIAFSLQGKKQIHAMWHMIAETDLRASFTNVDADDQVGKADLVDKYTFRPTGRRVLNVIHSEFRFRDGLIIEHKDSCSALKWGLQALGPVKGVAAWLIPSIRRAKALELLKEFIASHPEYAK